MGKKRFVEAGVTGILLILMGVVLIVPSSITGFATYGGIDQFPGIKVVLGIIAVALGAFVLYKQEL